MLEFKPILYTFDKPQTKKQKLYVVGADCIIAQRWGIVRHNTLFYTLQGNTCHAVVGISAFADKAKAEHAARLRKLRHLAAKESTNKRIDYIVCKGRKPIVDDFTMAFCEFTKTFRHTNRKKAIVKQSRNIADVAQRKLISHWAR